MTSTTTKCFLACISTRFSRALTAFSILILLPAMFTIPALAQTTPQPSQKTRPGTMTGSAAKSGAAANLKVAPDLAQRLAKFRRVEMPFRAAGLTPREQQLVRKLVEACSYLESIYWRQSDPDGLALYQSLAASQSPRDIALRRYLRINASRFDLIDQNKPFVGTDPIQPGRGFYPPNLTHDQIDHYLKEHPDQKSAIYDQFTIVRWHQGKLETVPYGVAYRSFLDPAARVLRAAAGLSADPAFATFLRLRADALLSDDYFPSDLAWLDLKNPKFDIIFAPYEIHSARRCAHGMRYTSRPHHLFGHAQHHHRHPRRRDQRGLRLYQGLRPYSLRGQKGRRPRPLVGLAGARQRPDTRLHRRRASWPMANLTNKPTYAGATSITFTAPTSITMKYQESDDNSSESKFSKSVNYGAGFGFDADLAPIGFGVNFDKKAVVNLTATYVGDETTTTSNDTNTQKTSSAKLDESNKYTLKLQGTLMPYTNDQFMASLNALTTASSTTGTQASKTAILPDPNLGGFTASNPPGQLPKIAPTEERFGQRMYIPSPYGQAFVTSRRSTSTSRHCSRRTRSTVSYASPTRRSRAISTSSPSA